jgi:bla regulator protein BlaR1
LRFAVEIDCDARVLRRGYDVTRYGETLIAVAERRSATIAMAAAMAESGSLLEQRIRNMVRKKTKHARATALALASLGVAFVVGAAEISPPNDDDAGKSASPQSAMDRGMVDGHVGFYRLSDAAVMTIGRNGEQLNAQLTGQKAVPIYARGNNEFSYKDKAISFVTQPDGQTTSLVLHQYGVDMPMPRIDAAAAQRIATAPRDTAKLRWLRDGPLIIRQ